MAGPEHDPDEVEARRAQARRTAWILLGVVVLIFILSIVNGALLR